MTVLPHVTVHLWTVPRRQAVRAMTHLGLDRGAVRRTPGLTFGKLVGTGTGTTFTPGDVDLGRWGLVAAWRTPADADAFLAHSPVVRRWRDLADESWHAHLHPLSSRGRWSGVEPFGQPAPSRHDGPVAAITRARIRTGRALTFWRAVPPVSAELHSAPGLRFAIGIGEAPIGLQGTLSLWDSSAALRDFAYSQPAHTDAIARTATVGWYAEELFARFAVLSSGGTVNGRDPAAADA